LALSGIVGKNKYRRRAADGFIYIFVAPSIFNLSKNKSKTTTNITQDASSIWKHFGQKAQRLSLFFVLEAFFADFSSSCSQ
jgi:hypothetical protein